MGPYGIGFCDTVVFNNQIRFDFLPKNGSSYTQYNYQGPTPLFVQIWHPIQTTERPYLNFDAFRKRELSSPLQSVYAPLISKMDSFFVQYNIIEDFVNYDSIGYGGLSYYQVLDTLLQQPTKSQYKRIAGLSNYPVIVYHHGGQGLSDENYIMAEYFASNGYIVVSSNFHLPFEDKMYGYEGIEFDDTALPKTVINFAKTLTSNNALYFIGHSAGAQVGFKFLFNDNVVKAFVSLETTMEGRPVDYLLSEDGWPELAHTIQDHQLDYTLPILMLANTQTAAPFPLFDALENAPITQVSQKKVFGHESYTSGYLMRYLHRHQFSQPDTTIMANQLYLYQEQLQLIHSFFNGIEKEQTMDLQAFQDDFFINQVNR